MKMIDRISGIISRVIPKMSLTDIIDINEQPLFKMPNYMFRMKYWLGALVAAALSFEVFSGLFLLLTYYPSDPYNQTMFLIQNVPFGAPILFSHLYGAYFMIFLIYLHLFRNYFDGAYKKPRQFLWVVGLILFALTLATAFTGYSLPADILGVDADGVAQGILSYLPGGSILQVIVFGNGLALDMYTRLLAWHIILTAMIGSFFVIHFLFFEQYGVMPSKKVKDKAPALYSKEEWKNFNPWWPRNFLYTLSLTLMIWGLILIVPNVLANLNGVPFLFQPAPAPSPTSPLALTVPPYPPWFFLFLYKAIDFNTPTGAPYNPVVASALSAIVPALYLLVLPWLDRSDETEPHKRPLWVGIGILLITYLVQLSVWAYTAPGVPEPFSVQLGIMLPPLIVAFLCVYLIPRFLARTRGELRLTPKTAALLIVAGLIFIGTLSSFMSQPTVYGLGIIIPIGMSYALFGRRVVYGKSASRPVVVQNSTKVVNRNSALFLMAALFITAFSILGLMFMVPTVGQPSTYWGIGTGIIFLIFSYALNLYDYLYFPQEDDEFRLPVHGSQSALSSPVRGSSEVTDSAGTQSTVIHTFPEYAIGIHAEEPDSSGQE